MGRPGGFKKQAVWRREDGIAMLTILMLTLILTVIGIAAITTTTMDLKLAGGELMRETSTNTAEACMSTAAQIIQQTLTNSKIPARLLAGPNPQINPNPLKSEIMGEDGFEQLNDTADFQDPANAPNAVLTVGGFTVNIDIDRLFLRPKAGGSLKASEGYSTGVPSFEVLYRISCYSSGGSGTIGHITGVYACPLDKGICRRQIGG